MATTSPARCRASRAISAGRTRFPATAGLKRDTEPGDEFSAFCASSYANAYVLGALQARVSFAA
jgi:hypothetical protein